MSNHRWSRSCSPSILTDGPRDARARAVHRDRGRARARALNVARRGRACALALPCEGMFSTRAASLAEFEMIARIITSSYRPHNPSGSMPDRHPVALDGPPFSWWGDPALSWWVALSGDQPAGFALWPHQERDVHLHSFFVASEAQRRGVGSALIQFHFEQSAKENPASDSLTLHVVRRPCGHARSTRIMGTSSARRERFARARSLACAIGCGPTSGSDGPRAASC